MITHALLRRLRRDRRGATVIEFAIVAPVMLALLMGIFDLLYQVYAQALLNGALQKAGRDSSIQGGAQNTATIDGTVIGMMTAIMKNPTKACPVAATGAFTWCSTRKSYAQFANIKPEDFTDSNGNGKRDAGECFTDINGNKTWDADPGIASQGGANDVTVYSMTVSYPRLFPVYGLFGWSPNQSISATTVLKNQPYATQSAQAVASICT
ncbi:TadE/TadG family type IV pilus assembly protein [uncultured Sphingomonas sp.]|uniref:TadE/TadG family type IV pilus assembly protein n=1 Tax=uncultured Sphingomonas sp. TaxID=158754 RepID=UPI0035CB70E8